MKILLLNPPDEKGGLFIREGRCTQQEGIWAALWPPISLVYIGTLLKEKKHDVKLIDCPAERISLKMLKPIIQSYQPDVIVWSTGTPTIESDLNLSKLIKDIKPSVKTAVFGTHVTVLDKECMERNPYLDVAVRNEPEYTIKEWIDAIINKKGCENVMGLTYRDKDDKITRNPPGKYISTLDELPFPDWSLVNTNSYRLPLKGDCYLMIAPLRGCPFPCTFCTCQTYYGNKLRLRSVSSIISEIRYDIQEFGVNNFFFWAETFTINQKFVKELCKEIILNNLDIKWTCNSRIDTVDREMLALMSEAGCWMISYGIESINSKILEAVKKNFSYEQISEAIRLTKHNGIMAAGHIIFGLPGETVESAKMTIKKVKELDLDFAQFYCAVPFPGSELYNTALNKGWIEGQGFESFRQEKAVMFLPTITTDQVEKIRKQAIKEFYGRFIVIKNIIRLIKPRAFGSIATSIFKFVKGLV